MNKTVRLYQSTLAGVLLFSCSFPLLARSQEFELKNEVLVADFGPRGLTAVTDQKSGQTVHIAADEFVLRIGGETIDSATLQRTAKSEGREVSYDYRRGGYLIRATYALQNSWRFVSKRVEILESPSATYTLTEVQPLKITLRDPIEGTFTPASYLPQLGANGKTLVNRFPDHQFGTFLRLQKQQGLMLLVQNPFLDVHRGGQDTSIAYRPAMGWNRAWGPWSSDLAVIGMYQQSGIRIPAQMVFEWKSVNDLPLDGADENEISAFTECVRNFLIHPAPKPISVEVGWTLNDYQIDVATPEGRAEYKRVMDTASDLGIQTLLYAPADQTLASVENDADDWNWEHVLWFGLGQKIRKGEWEIEKSPIPETVAEMLDYAKSKHLGLLAYVYPSLPFSQNPSWIVSDPTKKSKNVYATLASRDFQDFLIHELVAFKRRTGIAGYSFDYAFLDVPGSTAYAQWYGWRRVLESLCQAEPDIIIDGRQTYHQYGPWSWLAGSYPHPTGNDEQAESFTSYPDLHFDRVSADRTRFVNYWYRNYQFAPHEVVPGYMTHQTPRNRNVVTNSGSGAKTVSEIVYRPFRRRDWDYLGYQYSVLSSIATAGWNNVVSMIPGRDVAEFEHFSERDKAWIRIWLKWTADNKDLLKRTRTILGQPAMGKVDGTAAIAGDHGFVFLFNPNYKALSTEIRWDATSGVDAQAHFALRELYPDKGKLIGNPGKGFWTYGDALSLKLEGTSATVLELVPAVEFEARAVVFGVNSSEPGKLLQATLDAEALKIEHVSGKIGTKAEVSVLLEQDQKLKALEVNGRSIAFTQHGRSIAAPIVFGGAAFSHSQQVPLQVSSDGTFTGTFTVPRRIHRQLVKRRERWPIPWTKEDYATTWLVPERLLLFLQVTEPSDSIPLHAELDGSPLTFTRAYSSVREDPECFVGWYADLSTISVDSPHTIHLNLPQREAGHLQGLFFDNVEDEYTEQLAQ
jgi:hypothetical protein